MPPPSESSFVSKKEGWKTASKRYNNNFEMEGVGMNMIKEKRKRVMVVVDESIHSKHAMLWALTHVANKGDMLTLLEIQNTPSSNSNENEGSSPPANHLVTSLGTLCKACKPEVEVEALVVQGPKLATVVNQVKKLEVSVLVLGQNNSSPFLQCLGMMSSTEKFVEQCINNVECLTIGVRKQSRGIGGYLISTRWRKDFWLLA
ncbi:adenine nucleotide alpha hydrolases-like superfamily protein [Artemisia annua]|uniref:Adenine nucleotide alpha hydrolases-like superfamily protein n=1 Tax=Artemisia annua TaxID=35608 RepID=A0A2U1M4J3_ARTAN|nr:adenine nucleotide alpha hydrolases-like superfamily protein [Artemisia annua]